MSWRQEAHANWKLMAVELLEARQGRRTVIVLSDGIDVTSVLDAEAVSEIIRRSRATVYWVRLGDPGRRGHRSSAWRDAAEHRRSYEVLEQAVRASGGRILSLAKIDETRRAVDEIFAELRGQYAIGYYPEPARGDGEWRRVEVKVRGRGFDVRTREGYFDE